MSASVKQLRDNQNNFIYPKIAKEGLVEPIYGSDVGISAINGLQSSTVQGALNELAGNNVEIVKTASGSVISVSDSADYRLLGLKLYGKSVQDGVPTPEAPVEIESAGDGGNITTYVFGQNLIDPMGGNTWTSSGKATFEILGDGKIKVTGEMPYSNVLCVFPQNILNLIKGRTCVFSTVIDSKSVDTATVSGQITVTTASARKFYSNPGTPFVIDPDATKIQFGLYANNSGTTLETPNTVVFSDIGLYLGDTAQPWDTYEPMQTLTYPTPNGLPGIPVESGGNYTDAEGQQWICDEVDFGRGVYVKRIGVASISNTVSISNSRQSNPEYFGCENNSYKDELIGYDSNVMCDKLVARSPGTNKIDGAQITIVSNSGWFVFGIRKSAVSEETIAAVSEYLRQNPIMVTYGLNAPVETDLTPEQLAAYAALTTYKPNTTIMTDSNPAAGIEVRYLTDSGVSEVLDYYASKDDLADKQDKLSGTAGQFVGFDAEGEAEAQEITAADVGAVAADGTTAMAGDFNAGGHRVTNVGVPTAAGDAVRQSDLQAVSDEIDAIIAGTTPVTIPAATETKAGVVKPGEHLSVLDDGTINVTWPDLSGYATQAWVGEQGYLTAVPAEYITEDELSAKGYLTAVPAEYVTDTELTAKGYATTTDVAAAYAKKALKFTGAFTVAGWTSATGGYSQTINVSGLTADDEPIIDLNSTATDADTFNGQLEAFGLVSNFTTGAGTLTAVVLGDSAPTVDIPIHGVVVY